MSEKKLYKVRIERVIFVMAENEIKAEKEAKDNEMDDGSDPDEIHAEVVRQEKDIPSDWKGSIPYGCERNDSRTCEEIFKDSQ